MVVITQDANNIPRLLYTDATGRVYVLLSDGTTTANICALCGGLVTQGADAYFVSASNMWESSHKFVAVVAAATCALHIKVDAAANAHGHFVVMSEAKVTIRFYEGPTLTNDGVALTEPCLNRQTIGVAATQCFHTPVYAPAGLLLETGMLGTVGKFDDTGGAQQSHGFWLLKKSTSYLVEVTNNDAAAKDIVITYVWHEH